MKEKSFTVDVYYRAIVQVEVQALDDKEAISRAKSEVQSGVDDCILGFSDVIVNRCNKKDG